MAAAEIGREAGISQATSFTSKKKDDGLLPTEPLFLAGSRPVVARKLRYYADREFAGLVRMES